MKQPINNIIAQRYKIAEPSIAKITDDQLDQSLNMFTKGMSLRQGVALTNNHATAHWQATIIVSDRPRAIRRKSE